MDIRDLEIGQVHNVRVTDVRETSLFVDCEGVHGNVPMSELSWIEDVNPLLQYRVGDEIDALIVGINLQAETVNMSVRRADRDWRLTFDALQPGQLHDVRVIDIHENSVVVDCNGVRGTVHQEELSWDGESRPSDYSVGSTVQALIVSADPERPKLRLSVRRADTKRWRQAVADLDIGQIVHAHADIEQIANAYSRRKSHSLINVTVNGIPGVAPSKELSWAGIINGDFTEGEVVSAAVQEIDHDRRQLKLFLLDSDTEAWAAAVSQLRYGQVVEAQVTHRTTAFLHVEVRGVRGTVPAAELSWDASTNPSDYSYGQTAKASIVGIDYAQRRLRLSLRRADIEGWHSAVSHLERGKRYRAEIVRVQSAFLGVTVEGIAGSIHQRELSWSGDRTTADFRIGEIVDVTLMNVDEDAMDVFFSIRRADPAAWDKAVSQMSVGQVLSGRVTARTRNVLRVDVGSTTGVVFRNEISWNGSGKTSDYEIGDEVRVAVADIQWHMQELLLSIRRADQGPWIRQMREVSIGKSIRARVRFPNAVGVTLLFGELELFVPRSELPNPASDPRGEFRRGQLVEPLVMDIDRERCYVLLSFAKAINDAEFDQIVSRGESGIVEFKPGLKVAEDRPRNMEHEVLKTIVAFLNSVEGGWLLIGVTNAGEPIGLKEDGWDSADSAQMHLARKVEQRIGTEFSPLVQIRAFIPKGKEVVGVRCDPAPQGAVLDGEEYFYRDGSETRMLVETREILVHQRNLKDARGIRGSDMSTGEPSN